MEQKREVKDKREIKFRAWDTDTSQYVRCNHHAIGQIGNDYAGMGNRFVYQQFTGIHDKNGKEIYEGDIVLFDKKRKGKVVYSNTDTGFKILGQKDFYYHISDYDIEILGNIYEHPELLTAHET